MLKKLFDAEGKCECGKEHLLDAEIYSGEGILENIPKYVDKYSPKSIYVVCDVNTFRVAGERVKNILIGSGLCVKLYMFPESPCPNEDAVTLAYENRPWDVDLLIAVGSGVINDICKIISKELGIPYLIVATAPSMDGYASKTSSMTFRGLKISHPSRSADIIVGDIDVLKTAPTWMVVSGVGDMLAKYVSICEWRIANLLFGEYYCERIAELVRFSLKKCTENVKGLMSGDKEAISNVFSALTISSVAMNYAGVSRPASGCEHYISHMLDMRGEEFGTPTDFHGIQCAIGTYMTTKLYNKLLTETPNRGKALDFMSEFDYEKRAAALREYLGKGAESMITLEKKEGKFTKENHLRRLDRIIDSFDAILDIVREELPTLEYLDSLFEKLGLPTSFAYLGIDKETEKKAFLFSGDIRDKYVLSRLVFDLGIADEYAEALS